MNHWDFTEKLVVAILVAILAFAFGFMYLRAIDYQKACTSIGGETVWDGRQHQCTTAPKEHP